MATGYTYSLQNKNYNISKWLKEDLIRAMGICVALRDEGNLSEEEIEQKFNKSSDLSYTRERLTQLKRNLEIEELRTDDEWKKHHSQKIKSELDYYKNSLEKYDKDKNDHQKALDEVNRLLALAKKQQAGDLTINTLKFAQEQLTSTINCDYSDNYRPCPPTITNTTFKQYKRNSIKLLKDEIRRKEEDLDNLEEMKENRLSSYKKFIEFVNFCGQ